jgi:hypothetical protein
MNEEKVPNTYLKALKLSLGFQKFHYISPVGAGGSSGPCGLGSGSSITVTSSSLGIVGAKIT